MATLYDVPESFLALSNKYQHGIGVRKDIETSVRYGRISATVASIDYNKVGGQPLHQNDVINDNTESIVEKGNKGTDDEILQYQMIRAKEGDLASTIALGDGFYFGSGGLMRDHPRALEYYNDAMLQGDPYSKCCVASMHLKGEGTLKNVTKAINLYEEAVAQNASVKAMNGLGYMYFYGSEVDQNYTKAFEYFSQAAYTESDSDSIFNTGYCYEFGLGTEQNLNTAFQYYQKAALKFGHFESINKLSIFYTDGISNGVKRSTTDAILYTNAVNGLGSWY
jgi:SEL1 protein